jgi:hypothetical protein
MFTRFIVANFGFLYNTPGRLGFLAFLAMLSWSLGLMGKVCFALLISTFCLEIYLRFKMPKFGEYMEKSHYFDTVVARHVGLSAAV